MGLDLFVQPEDVSVFDAHVGLGAELALVKGAGYTIATSLSGLYAHDHAAESRDFHVRFDGFQGPIGLSPLAPEKGRGEFGLGLAFVSDTGFRLEVGVDLDRSTHYRSDSGMIRGNFRF